MNSKNGLYNWVWSTSIGMMEKHYSYLTPTLGANKLAGNLFPDLSK